MNGEDNIRRTRRQRLLQGIQVGHKQYGVKKSELTGMYRAVLTIGYDSDGEPDISTGIEEDGNYCAVCLFLEDDPNNYGEIITPTSYDADCDDCGKHALPYAEGSHAFTHNEYLLMAAAKEEHDRLENEIAKLLMTIATHEQTIERLTALMTPSQHVAMAKQLWEEE